MLIYFSFYFSAIFSYWIADNLNHRVKYLFFLLSFLLVWLFAGLRGTVGQDTKSYTAHFESLYTFSDMIDYFGDVEPLFALLVVFLRLLFDDVNIFFLIVSLIQSLLVFFVSRRMHHGFIFFSLYLLIFYADFQMNVLRAGMAGLFFLAALSVSDNRKLAWALFLASVFSHISILIFFPVYAFRLGVDLKLILKVVLSSVLTFFCFYYFYSDTLAKKFSIYFVDGVVNREVPEVPVFLSLVGFGLLMISKKLRGEYVAAFILFSIIWVGSTQITILYRLVDLSLVALLFLSLEHRAFSGFYVRPIVVYTSTLALWFVLSSYTEMINESAKFKANGRGDLEYTYIPYTSVISE